MWAKWFVVGLVVVAGAAEAHVLSERECSYLARDVHTIAEARDGGMTLDQAQKALQSQLAQVMGDPNSYVQDDEDVEALMDLLPQIWKVDASAEALAHSVKKQCDAIAQRGV